MSSEDQISNVSYQEKDSHWWKFLSSKFNIRSLLLPPCLQNFAYKTWTQTGITLESCAIPFSWTTFLHYFLPLTLYKKDNIFKSSFSFCIWNQTALWKIIQTYLHWRTNRSDYKLTTFLTWAQLKHHPI